MAQKKKHRHRSIMGRSDIPYAQRLKMQQQSNIAACRGHSARVALYINSVALHQVEGIGYQRLVRYSFHYKELEGEFYDDPDVGMAHATQRMKELGMPISGEFFGAPDKGQSRRQLEIDTHAVQATQVAMIVSAIAMNDVFGFGYERQVRVRERIAELTARYRDEGIGFILEEMEKIGFKIVDGIAKLYMDDDGKAVTVKKAEAMIAKEEST
jgi:hypothetical protein